MAALPDGVPAREALDGIRRERLADALHRAARTPCFAPHLTAMQILPERAESVLAGLPVLEKETLRHAPESVTTGLVDAWDELRVHTSGTTGDPVWITHDDSWLTESAATNLRFLAAYGLSPGLRIIRATADPAHAPVAFATVHYLGSALLLRINVSAISSRDTRHLERLCADFKPDIPWGSRSRCCWPRCGSRRGRCAFPSCRRSSPTATASTRVPERRSPRSSEAPTTTSTGSRSSAGWHGSARRASAPTTWRRSGSRCRSTTTPRS
ncbi:hypothetical protein [Streptomyces sp. NPDC086787]|uniref:hypothetical protein n=1 Tax=Streptomyces sp. NPDC086787 TaxID=3365759 RepID=UPI0037F52E8D